MRRAEKRGPGSSHLLMTPDRGGNVAGVDPHKGTPTATVVDARGGILASAHFRVSGEGSASWRVGAAVWADRPLGDRRVGELGPAHGGVLDRPRARRARCVRESHTAV